MITNTTKIPMAHGMTPSMIEAQEAQGQRELINSAQLPVDIDPISRAKLESAGVVFGAVSKGDPMFRTATLPAGWRKAATSHSMWSDLLDENGDKRAAIFYKAAFYDRSAHMYSVDVVSIEPVPAVPTVNSEEEV